MGRALAEIRRDEIKKYGTKNQSYRDLPTGTRVLVITPCCDFRFFHNQTGVIEKSEDRYLGITVKFDKAMRYEGGQILTKFNFHPSDLAILKQTEENLCPYCNQALKGEG